jgi:hypothetical protein
MAGLMLVVPVMVVTMVTMPALARPPGSAICRRRCIAVYRRGIPGDRCGIKMTTAPDHVDPEPDRRIGVTRLCHGSKGQSG